MDLPNFENFALQVGLTPLVSTKPTLPGSPKLTVYKPVWKFALHAFSPRILKGGIADPINQ